MLISTTKKGLQKCIDAIQNFTTDWHLTINLEKTKTLIFNKKGEFLQEDFKLGDESIQCTDSYTYLGIDFNNSGNFQKAIESLYNKSLKALFKLNKLITGSMSIQTILHIFDNTIKPILLYGAEVWSPYLISPRDLKMNKWTEKLDKHKPCQLEIKFYKHILKIKTKSSTAGVRGELGRHPILLNALTNSLKYLETVKSKPDNKLVKEALKESNLMQSSDAWHTRVKTLSSSLKTELPISTNKNTVKRYSDNILHEMKITYEKFWHCELTKTTSKTKNKGGNKLRSYNILKNHFNIEPYLQIVDIPEHRRAITQLRLSSHNLNIETMRGTVEDPNQRKCKKCGLDEKEDEEHFLIRCQAYTSQRESLISIAKSSCNNTSNYGDSDWYIFLMTSEDKKICRTLGKFIFDCMNIRKLNS